MMGSRRPITTDDLFRVRWVDTPRLASDGTWLAYVERWLDRERDALRSRICCIAITTGVTRYPTPDGADERLPRPCPDGRRLAFLSNRAGSWQVWVADLVTGEAHPVSGTLVAVDEPAWSPDGARLVFSAATGSAPTQPELITKLRYKADGVGLLPPTRRHLWVVSASGGTATQLTEGDWDDSCPAFSPDGHSIAFLSNRTPERDLNGVSDLWVMPVAGGGATCLTAGKGPIRTLAWSPDSRAIAYLGHDQGSNQGANVGLWTVGLDGSVPRHLSAALDRSLGLTVRADDARGGVPELAWVTDDDGDRLYCCYADRGRSWLAWFNLLDQHGVVIGGERAVLSFDVNAVGQIAFVASAATQPGEVALTTRDGAEERVVTTSNAAWLADVEVSRPLCRPFQADDGELIDSWLVRPPGVSPGERRPLILNIHGGPHYPLGERFYFEFQRLAAQGYNVLYVNPRGSQGYGEAFATAIRGAWGERDMGDLGQALDAALADGIGDPQRLGVTGVSYGGYMTLWLAAQTDRFAVAVSENGISNLTSNFGTTGNAGQSFWSWELDGTPLAQLDRYRERSPLTHAARITAPVLLIHAEQDHNCSIGQSEEMFVALKMLGREVALGRVPGEGHLLNLVGRPSHRLLRTAWLDEWFAHYLAPGGAA